MKTKEQLEKELKEVKLKLIQIENELKSINKLNFNLYYSILKEYGFTRTFTINFPNHWLKEINKQYTFWFSLDADNEIFCWGVSDIEKDENYHKSLDFKSFHECILDFQKEQDLFKIQTITLKVNKTTLCHPDHTSDIIGNMIYYLDFSNCETTLSDPI